VVSADSVPVVLTLVLFLRFSTCCFFPSVAVCGSHDPAYENDIVNAGPSVRLASEPIHRRSTLRAEQIML